MTKAKEVIEQPTESWAVCAAVTAAVPRLDRPQAPRGPAMPVRSQYPTRLSRFAVVAGER
ncbi:MAG: hypothetical protein QOK05_1413 [Chloroflexota bacterium]|jgi:hypothetical protein|nr:hypothetical protein [Chloroflexota bacterium]